MKQINFVNKQKYYFAISGALILVSIVFLVLFGLKLSIEFSGGSQITYSTQSNNKDKILEIFKKNDVEVVDTVETDNTITIQTQTIEQKKKDTISSEVTDTVKDTKEESFESIGPVIGRETQIKALQSVSFAIVAILVYIAIVFRQVSKPVASWKYGVTAIIALAHDIILTIGLFSALGYFFGVEVDPLFITALLTIMGFSVHDTIVTFDRIRENLKSNVKNIPFKHVINNSIVETLNRSINTSVTVVFVLSALLLFGGETVRWFVAALTAGIVFGTYSSIFIASQLLIAWYDWDKERKK